MKRCAIIRGSFVAALSLLAVACDNEQDIAGPSSAAESNALDKGGNRRPGGGVTVQKIAFYVGGPNGAIHAVNPDGTGYAEVANTAGAVDPAWSPDRKQLAFAIPTGPEAGLYVISANGRKRVRLYSGQGAGAPAWSPDGIRIAFHAAVSLGTQLFVVDAAGGNLHQITAVGTVNNHPSWSPDGTRMVFFSNRVEAHGLWRMSSNGTNRTMILRCYDCSSPTWSPVVGDERIAFNVFNDGSLASNAIGIVNSNGSDRRQIVYGAAHATRDLRPSWSPDATQLVFHSSMMGAGTDLIVVDDDGTDAHRITTTLLPEEQAAAWAR